MQRHIKFIYSLVFIHSIIVLDHLFSSLLPFTRFFFFFSWLHSPGRLDILLQVATKNRLRIIAIQESWWPGVGEFRRNDYTIIHSGSQVESRHRQGVMLILHNSIARHISVTQTRMSTSNHASLYHSLGKYLPVYSVALINEISRCTVKAPNFGHIFGFLMNMKKIIWSIEKVALAISIDEVGLAIHECLTSAPSTGEAKICFECLSEVWMQCSELRTKEFKSVERELELIGLIFGHETSF